MIVFELLYTYMYIYLIDSTEIQKYIILLTNFFRYLDRLPKNWSSLWGHDLIFIFCLIPISVFQLCFI